MQSEWFCKGCTDEVARLRSAGQPVQWRRPFEVHMVPRSELEQQPGIQAETSVMAMAGATQSVAGTGGARRAGGGGGEGRAGAGGKYTTSSGGAIASNPAHGA